MSLIEELKALKAKRQSHLDAVAEIDRELSAALALLSGALIADAGAENEPSFAGRFCSRACYGGGPSVEERRTMILEALQHGPKFAAEINQLPWLRHVSRGTVHNDLSALRSQDLVESCDEGWRITVKDSEDEPIVPLVSGLETAMPSQTSPQSSSDSLRTI